jgi:Tfp pilus assembly protein PilO
MMRLFVPLILLAAAIGLFVVYTNPTYQTIKDLQIQNNSYDDALNKAQELHAVRDQLLSKRNSFSTDDIDKLQHILPDNVDNIRLIIDINNIASRHNLSLTNVDLGDLSLKKNAGTAVEGGADPVGSVVVGFAVSTANYDDFLSFLQDLEHSLRLVDVNKISFTAGTGGGTTYTMNIQTYWLH